MVNVALPLTTDPVAYLGHWPAPAMSARFRMYRGDSWEKIPAAELITVTEGTVPGLHPATRQFFASWLGPEARAGMADAARRW